MAEETKNSPPAEAPPANEHLNIKVTDNNNEVFFKIKRTTQLKKLMDAFCDRQGKQIATVRFLFDGTRVRPEDTPETVRRLLFPYHWSYIFPFCGNLHKRMLLTSSFSLKWRTAIR